MRPKNVSPDATLVPFQLQSPTGIDTQVAYIQSVFAQVAAMNAQRQYRFAGAMNDWNANDSWYQSAHMRNPQPKPTITLTTVNVVWADSAGNVGKSGPLMNAWLEEKEVVQD